MSKHLFITLSQQHVLCAEKDVATQALIMEKDIVVNYNQSPAELERPVSEVMDPPFPEVEAGTPVDRVGAMLTRESPAALVRKDGKLIGIVSRYDVLQQLIGTR